MRSVAAPFHRSRIARNAATAAAAFFPASPRAASRKIIPLWGSPRYDRATSRGGRCRNRSSTPGGMTTPFSDSSRKIRRFSERSYSEKQTTRDASRASAASCALRTEESGSCSAPGAGILRASTVW